MSGKTLSEADQKLKLLMAQQIMLEKLSATNRFKQDEVTAIDAQLKVEEELAQKLLDENMNKNQELEILKEKSDEEEKKRKHNREELIKKNTDLSCLLSRNKKTKEELEALLVKNKELEEKNKVWEKKNKDMEIDIFNIIQRIELNSLLKEVDMEDMKLLAKNNAHMNKQFEIMVAKWNRIFDAKPEEKF